MRQGCLPSLDQVWEVCFTLKRYRSLLLLLWVNAYLYIFSFCRNSRNHSYRAGEWGRLQYPAGRTRYYYLYTCFWLSLSARHSFLMIPLVYSALVRSGVKFCLMFSVSQQALVFLLDNVPRQVCLAKFVVREQV